MTVCVTIDICNVSEFILILMLHTCVLPFEWHQNLIKHAHKILTSAVLDWSNKSELYYGKVQQSCKQSKVRVGNSNFL